jgi:hypothetical protein
VGLVIVLHKILFKVFSIISILKNMIKYPELQIALDQYDKLASEVSFNGKKILPPEGYLIGQIADTNNGMLVEFVKNPEEYKIL